MSIVDARLRPTVDEATQEVGQIAQRIDGVQLAGLDQRGNRSPVCVTLVRAGAIVLGF